MLTPPTEPGLLPTEATARPGWVGVIGILSIIVAGLTFLSASYSPVQIMSLRFARKLWSDEQFQGMISQAPPPQTRQIPVTPVNPPPAATPPSPAPVGTPPAAAGNPPGRQVNYSMVAQMFDYPPWFEGALAARGVLDLLLAAILLFGGIQLLRCRPSYRAAHLVYAVLALVSLMAWLVVCALSATPVAMNPAWCAVLLTLPYPIVALVFMFGRERTDWYQGLRAPEPPRPTDVP